MTELVAGSAPPGIGATEPPVRAITVDDTTYETVPAGLITRAGLLAAAELLAQPSASHDDPTQETTGTTETCCGPTAEPTDLPNRSLPLATKAGCC